LGRKNKGKEREETVANKFLVKFELKIEVRSEVSYTAITPNTHQFLRLSSIEHKQNLLINVPKQFCLCSMVKSREN
jgi:hypothetical protein